MGMLRKAMLGLVAIIALAAAVTENTTIAWGRAIVALTLLCCAWVLTRLQRS